jgi:hypothetical protein
VPGSPGFANFGFNAQRTNSGVSGQLEYVNHSIGLNVHSVSITSVCVSGNSANIMGTCIENNSTSCSFNLCVQDNGEPGSGVDKFIITVTGAVSETRGGTIARGNIQVH